MSGWWSRLGGRRRRARRETLDYLDGWLAGRRGVEVFVEPQTAVTEVSMLLVAHDGEFTRRTVGTPDAAKEFAHEHSLPIYDATIVGYPQRMRDYSRRTKVRQERTERQRLDGR